MHQPIRDVFICHASEDKNDVVRPLVEAFSEAGISCWFDEAEIQWGDSITQKVNDGLAKSRFVLVVIGSAFVQKNWPQRELFAILNQEASSGEVKVLPLLVGTIEEKKHVIDHFPLLNDKKYLSWNADIKGVIEAMNSRLGRGDKNIKRQTADSLTRSGPKIPLPVIKKEFTQRDKDVFLKNSFTIVKQYFQSGLEELAHHYQEIETDYSEVHAFKFIATTYLRGKVANRCKIWLGGLSSSNALAYHEGQFNIDGDSSYSDILSVIDNEQTLGFKPSGMWFGTNSYSAKGLFTTEEAAEYLWRRFTEGLS